jgi:hypothetical protein
MGRLTLHHEGIAMAPHDRVPPSARAVAQSGIDGVMTRPRRIGPVSVALGAFGVCLVAIGAVLSFTTHRVESQAANPNHATYDLASLAGRAQSKVQATYPQAPVVQIDVDFRTGRQIVRLTDSAATREISVMVDQPGAHPDRWGLSEQTISPLANAMPRPTLPVETLRRGPAEAAQVLVERFPGAQATSVTLAAEGDALVWHVFGEISGGVIRGQVRDATGVLQVDGPGRPMRPPSVAAPPLP